MINFDYTQYPLDSKFIKICSAEERNRLSKCGLKDDQILVFVYESCPITGAGGGLIRDYTNKVFYKILGFTKGILENITDLELRVIVDHEESEIQESIADSEKECYKSLASHESEVERHVSEIDSLKIIYGEDVVNSAIVKAQCSCGIYPLIPRYILLYWMYEFVIENASALKKFAIPMTEHMLAPQQVKQHKQLLDKIFDEYRRIPSNRSADIFKAALMLIAGK